ncbi:MAG: hypothetical protein KBT03_06120 [Bacteroidales bacterium]|nr:hypothetical protein [Candidatus Scybalousia scybalohippi]
MSMNLIRWENQTVTPKHDSIQWDDGRCGIMNGCEISHIGANKIRITSGYIVILGRLIEVSQEDINVNVSESGEKKGQLFIRMNLASDEPIQIISEAADEITELTQENNANYINGIYELQLCKYNINETTISNMEITVGKIENLGNEVRELKQNLIADGVPFRFGKTEDGKYGYILNEGGADTVIPFKSGGDFKWYKVTVELKDSSGTYWYYTVTDENGDVVESGRHGWNTSIIIYNLAYYYDNKTFNFNYYDDDFVQQKASYSYSKTGVSFTTGKYYRPVDI